jgi:hypothetical protein
MKIIKYQICTCVNHGTEETPEWEDVLSDVKIRCTADKLEANLAIARAESYNGIEPEVTDDGKPEPDNSTTDDVLNALLGVTD